MSRKYSPWPFSGCGGTEGRGLASVHFPAVMLFSLTMAALMLLSSPGALSAFAQVQTGDQGAVVVDGDARSVTRLLPSWDAQQWDWSSFADEDGHIGVIVSLPEGDAGKLSDSGDGMRFLDIELVSGRGYTHAFSGFSAEVTAEVLDTLLSLDDSISVYPDLPVQAFMTESVAQIGADELWERTDGYGQPVTGTGIVVAVIDTGIDYMHPDLGEGFGPSYKVIGGYDFYYHDSDPMDDNGHGTHVAGTIAADGGIMGVAPGAKLLAYKTLGPDGQGSMSDVIAAIDRAMDPNGDGDTSDRADVISMSLGGAGEATDPVCLAVTRAVEAGIVVVAASGNEGPSMGTVASPGIAYDAITVGAVDDDGVLAAFSSRGAIPDLTIKPEISAPGVAITSTVPTSGSLSSPTGYLAASGTSMATPHVSGGVALLLQLHPDWTPEQVKSAIITSANGLDESIWSAGAGEMWLPAAADTTLFPVPALISYGFAGAPVQTATVTNTGSYVSLASSSEDWLSLSADGVTDHKDWANMSTASPSTIPISSGSSGTVTLSVPSPGPDTDEGYYEGDITLTYASVSVSIPFGFAALSTLNVHVLDEGGREVNDPYGGVWAYRLPYADLTMMMRGNMDPAPPASFLVPSGDYSVIATGHQDIYSYNDPYLLSDTVTVGRLSTVDVYLTMSTAREMVLDLETDEGIPIYVKDYRVYLRHEGTKNISFHLVGSDYSVSGSDIFSLPHSKTLFVSDTDENIGISISGFSYTAPMWEFMSRNWHNWYEYTSGTSTDFYVEAGADLQYLLAWEFDGVDGSTPTALTLVDGEYSVYETKYDIPGEVTNIWGDWGNHLSIGGDAAFFVRRDTDTSLNSFFSGMTRTTIVQGVFSELYFPQSIFGGYSERSYYSADYDHLVGTSTASSIQLPDRNYLEPVGDATESERLGAGPYYPSVYTVNGDDTLVLFHPLLRDQAGAKVGGISTPSLSLYKGGQFVGIYQLSEFLSRPDAVRTIDLMGAGEYVARIAYMPSAQICDDVTIELGFTAPGADSDPPVITAMEMSQKFVPGDSVGLQFSVSDASGIGTVEVSWRANEASGWTPLTVNALGGGNYGTSIPTQGSDGAIHLKIKVADPSDNYIEYTASNAALAEVPVVFELSADETEIGYRSADEVVVLVGELTDMSGEPLHPSGAVPIELTVDGVKVGLILDEYVTTTSHTHDGSIRFEWHFDPLDLFGSQGDTVTVTATFDLGIYETVTRTIEFTSSEYTNALPTITLVSPSDGDLISPGTPVDLRVEDDGTVTAEWYLDGAPMGALSSPWDISTSTWSDGTHTVTLVATDDLRGEAEASFVFEVDGSAPIVSITHPEEGMLIPQCEELVASISDEHLASATWRVDGGAQQAFAVPYTVDMTGWATGAHTVEVTATDLLGNSASASTSFEISDQFIVILLESPVDDGVVKSGNPLEFSFLGLGEMTAMWSIDGIWHDLGEPYAIQTDGWEEGIYEITVNVTNDLGQSAEQTFTITVDDTPPEITLISPTDGAFVNPYMTLIIEVSDVHLDLVSWVLWGVTRTTPYHDVYISLATYPADGFFTVAVIAQDLAGNEAHESFVFAMDSTAPLITVENLGPGGAIKAGTPVDVSVEDAFLAEASWSLDSGTLEPMATPQTIDTSSWSSGWHSFQVYARDHSGQVAWHNQSLYVDETCPTIRVDSNCTYTAGGAATISAMITDDYYVQSAVLYYGNGNGTYTAVQMRGSGGVYIADIDSTVVWDGMDAFVVAVDAAGNTAESDPVVLALVEEQVADDEDPEGPSDGTDDETQESDERVIFYAGIASLGGAAALFSMIAVLRSRKGGKSEGHAKTGDRPKRPVQTAAKTEGIATTAPARPSAAFVADPRRLPKTDATTGVARPRNTARNAGKTVVKVPLTREAYARMQQARTMGGASGGPRNRQS